VSEAQQPPLTMKFIGGTMHGKREQRRSFAGLIPRSVLVPAYGKRNEDSVLREAPIVGRETYVRSKQHDEGVGDARVIAYMFDTFEPAIAPGIVPTRGGRR
jgi:hypothetical protein